MKLGGLQKSQSGRVAQASHGDTPASQALTGSAAQTGSTMRRSPLNEMPLEPRFRPPAPQPLLKTEEAAPLLFAKRRR